MPSLAADLKQLRQEVEKLQVEVAGRQSISAMVVWDGQNESYVNEETNPISGTFSGLVIHLTPEPSTQERTVSCQGEMLSNLEFKQLREEIVRSLDSPTSPSNS